MRGKKKEEEVGRWRGRGRKVQKRMRPSSTPRANRMRTSMTIPREASKIGTIFSKTMDP
jgi:hypothetical protein